MVMEILHGDRGSRLFASNFRKYRRVDLFGEAKAIKEKGLISGKPQKSVLFGEAEDLSRLYLINTIAGFVQNVYNW